VTDSLPRPKLAVVSPFLDKQHGTERIVAEWIERLAGRFEIHIYSQRVADVDLSRVTWHRIPKLPGPHLFSFLWWFAANRISRSWHRRFRGLRPDLVFSPGVNCLDADAVSVHVVFAEYTRKHRHQLRLHANPVSAWPRLVHRRLYYAFVIGLERRLYTNPRVALIATSRNTVAGLESSIARSHVSRTVYPGLDLEIFNRANRAALRPQARQTLGLSGDRFTLLLVGNDWRNKGLPVLLDALAQLRGLAVDLLVVSREESADARDAVRGKSLEGRVHFCPPRKDVEFYYAAADAYAGPSLEDTFALPAAEAMACGLPVIVSAEAGVSEIVTDGVDGLILRDPLDAAGLATMIRGLFEDAEWRERLGRCASDTARKYTWERSASDLADTFNAILSGKTKASTTGAS